MRAMRFTWTACLATVMLMRAGSEAASQLPGAPTSVHGCLRVDVEKTKEVLRDATARGAGAASDVEEVQKEIDGCTFYTITFVSSVNVVSDVPGEGSRKITGRGTITFGLTTDMSEPDFDLTSGPAELTAPIFWSAAEIVPGNNCTVSIVALPYTAFSFWLGVKGGVDPNVAVQIVPSGGEMHPIRKKCPHPAGGRSVEVPGFETIFSPAWIALHGDGSSVAAQPGVQPQAMMDIEKMKADALQQPPMMDMKKLQEMADRAKGKDMSPAEMMAMMKEVVPDAEMQVEAARDNFMVKMPGDCANGVGGTVRCSIKRTVTLPDGKGTTQNITESTEITIARVAPGGAGPAGTP